MTAPETGTLSTDFDVMRSVADRIDARNDEIRAMLASFIGRTTNVPSSVWGGNAAAAFRQVVGRWNAESLRLYQALTSIAETIRLNEAALREAGETHSHHIGAVARDLSA